MTEQFTVRIFGHGAAQSLHRRIIASLPNHFRIVGEGRADAALFVEPIDVPPEAGIIVLHEPSAMPKLVKSSSAIIPSLCFAPRLAADGAIAAARETRFALIDVVSTQDQMNPARMRSSLLDQLTMVRIITGARPILADIRRVGSGYVASAGVGGQSTVITLAGWKSPAGTREAAIDAVAVASRIHVEMNDGAIASPARILSFDSRGTSQAPLVHQSGHRLTWLKVHGLLSGTSAAANDELMDFEEALTEIEARAGQ